MDNHSNNSAWLRSAACVGEDPELFFPTGRSASAKLQAEEAKRVCVRCEVREACLEWALETGADHGVWGALDEDERTALRRRRQYTQKIGETALG